MACCHLKLTTIISLVSLILLSLHSLVAFSNDIEVDEEQVYNPSSTNLRSRSRFFYSVVGEGTLCNPIHNNICNGISLNMGKSLLHCCKTRCCDVLKDKNHCGQCGNPCKEGQRCCNGTCVNTAFNVNHCGECNKKCGKGVKCEYGYCGYA